MAAVCAVETSPEQGRASADEVERIRQAMSRRDRPRRRPSVLHAAAARLADERRAQMLLAVRRVFPAGWPGLLDVGCGEGADLEHWIECGWPPERLAGVDLVPGRVDVARRRVPGADVRVAEGFLLPFESASFDVVTASTVFSSILEARLRRELYDDMVRVTRPGGMVLIYDFRVRKPTNHRVVAIDGDRLRAMAPRADRLVPLSPFIYAVAVADLVHPRLGDLAMRHSPRTHFLASWHASPETRG